MAISSVHALPNHSLALCDHVVEVEDGRGVVGWADEGGMQER